MVSQGLLFSEPSVAETGVWCTLSEGIDPAQWASICRYIGTRSREEFEHIRDAILPIRHSPKKQRSISDSISTKPLISIGPSGIGGKFQSEYF
jgi:hypothetical protein